MFTVQVWIAGELYFDETYDYVEDYVEAVASIAEQYVAELGFTIVVDIAPSK